MKVFKALPTESYSGATNADLVDATLDELCLNSTPAPAADEHNAAKKMTETVRIQWEKQLLEKHRGSFETIRKDSTFASYGKDKAARGKDKPRRKGSLPETFSQNMENAVATSLRKKQLHGRDLRSKVCPVREKASALSDADWPEEKVAEVVAEAEKVIRNAKPRSVLDVFKAQPPTKTSTQSATAAPALQAEEEQIEAMPIQMQEPLSKGSGEYIVQLGRHFKIPSTLLGEYFRRDSTLNQAARGLVSNLQDLDADKALADDRAWSWTVSQFKSQNINYDREKATCAQQLGRLAEVIKKKEELRQKRLSWIDERRQTEQLNGEMEVASGRALKSITLLKGEVRRNFFIGSKFLSAPN